MRLTVLEDERFSCHGCTDCCRHWHVQLVGDEASRLAALPWRDDDPTRGRDVLLRHGTRTFLRHEPDGACVMLDQTTGRCRIHERFGEQAKPIGCRLFPFTLARTFGDEVTVAARFTCPTVQRNAGRPHAEHLDALRRLAPSSVKRHGFDDEQLCHLDPDEVRAITEFIATLLGAFESSPSKALFLHALCLWLAMRNTEAVDRAALGEAFPSLREHVEATLGNGAAKPAFLHRLAFGAVWASHLRRDEDVLDGRTGRAARLAAVARTSLLRGNLAKLGHDHPAGSVRRARLFTRRCAAAEPEAFDVFWRMIRQKLATHQFMGSANFGRNLLEGLLDLCTLYLLVAASACYHAAARGAARVEAEDVARAVAAIERGFGRNPLLDRPAVCKLKMMLLRPGVYERLALNL